MQRSSRYSYKALLLCTVLLGIAGCNHPPAISQRSDNATQSKAAVIKAGEIGSSFPDFSVTDLQGRPLSSAGLRGKVVLVDFWATWCQPCRKEMPGYQKLVQRYGSRGFAVIGFKFDTMADMEDPLAFARGIGAHYPLAVASGEIKKKFGGIDALPTTMIYDRRGFLRYKVLGFEYTDTIESVLKPLL